MKTTKEMIEVMEHFDKGGEVERVEKGYDDWVIADNPRWNWFDYEYRIKQQKQTITMEKWLMKRSDEYYVLTTNKISNYSLSTPVKLLETYEIEI